MNKWTPPCLENKTKKRVVKTVKTPVRTATSVSVRDVSGLVESWKLDAQGAGFSARYIVTVTDVLSKLLWWMGHTGERQLDAASIRRFMLYLQTGHQSELGRWHTNNARSRQPLSAETIRDYYKQVRTFCSWLVDQHVLDVSPIESVRQPIHRNSGLTFHVFTPDDVARVVAAAGKSSYAKRDTALVLMLLDTGLRATEICGLTWADVDQVAKRAVVREDNAKGGKLRHVFWSKSTSKALWAWMQSIGGWVPEDPVFVAMNGGNVGGALTRHGLLRLIHRLGAAASVAHCHPHTFRHTFATMFLLAGGNQITLMELMGHSSIVMTRRYIRFTGADLASQARQFSSVEYARRCK
jgi:integrase/recombinase XerD